MSNFASHGRGGAGNMAKANGSPKLTASDLETPTLKKSVVTTGRGGQGNMAKNTDPKQTRTWQDVEAVPRSESTGPQHAGRGGAGNVYKGEETDAQRQKQNETGDDTASDSATEKAGEKLEKVPSKGKNWLFGGKKEKA